VKALLVARGDIVYTLPSEELERWRRIAMPVGDEWIADMNAKKMQGLAVLQYTVGLFMQIQKE
jgi:hypothetical protein